MPALLEDDMLESPPSRRRFSREEYHRMLDAGYFVNERVERIRGEIVSMSPEGKDHWLTIVLTQEALREAFGSGYFVTANAPFPTPDSDPQPDISVIPGRP
jgi:Uma2 family endonuclease